MEIFKLEEDVTMVPVIDKRKTGEQIRKYMNLRGLTVQDVKTYLSLGCVQSVYHWLDGQSAPSLDNLYALSGNESANRSDTSAQILSPPI